MRIVVRGDGIAAHLAALMLARAALDVVRVGVGNGDHGLGPVGHAVLGLPDWQASEIAGVIGWVPGSAVAHGIGFSGWAAEHWFWPFGEVGAPLDGVAFPQVVARLRADDTRVDLADFALGALAARADRFAAPSPDPRSPLATVDIGVSYPAAALSERLSMLAQAAGVTVSDQLTEADLIVDASGGSCSTGAWESWAAWLPCNRAAAHIVPSDRPPPPYPIHAAAPDGWRATVALDGAFCETAYSVGGPGVPYDNGVRRMAWTGRRVAIGAAAGVVEPVLGTALSLAHDAIARLITLLPHDPGDTRVEASEYNRVTAAQHEGARDAALALWATNARTGEPLWDRTRDETTQTLARKLALYRSRGWMPMEEDEPMSRTDWIALLDGQGVRQRRLDPVTAAIPADAARAHCGRIRERFAATVRTLPRHADALAHRKGRR